MKQTTSSLLLTIALTGAWTACDTTKKTATTPPAKAMVNVPTPPPPPAEPPSEPVKALNFTFADTLPLYQATSKKAHDLVHTELDVRFDWAKKHLLGKAVLTLKPHFYDSDVLELDAKSFDIHRITDEKGAKLSYEYADNVLKIKLLRPYKRAEQYKVLIDYTAKPDEAPVGGSAAIQSDKGLFFINADGADLEKPQQIWTQGETQSNSRWFPTIDRPNQRMTNQITMTVADKYKTLSNGLLKKSQKNADGTRTDTWVMDMPHAPYLVMMAVGDFAIVEDKWRGKPLMYYVEPKYKDHAKSIFKNTPELLEFYSTKLGVEYPWQKYAQIVVRDYVSGAMENTTSVIFGEFMNGTERELIDNDQNESVVAHEMFHHWFGDLVTAESWSNLTVNESFANYSEVLWFENKYGKDFGMHHLEHTMEGYIGEAQRKTHPLVDFTYSNREDMFDAHSYNKGGCILNMLRNYVGDEAFFLSLNKYLTDNKFKTGEAHQLRLAFEEVTGEDLTWFWNQWYFKAGHPVLDISYKYDEAKKTVQVDLEQKQEGSEKIPAIFELPLMVDVYHGAGKAVRHSIRMVNRKQSFTFAVSAKPDLVNVDAQKMLLCEKKDNHTEAEWIYQFSHAPEYFDRKEALEALKSKNMSAAAKSVFVAALKDKFWGIREDAIKNLGIKDDPSALETISTLATSDPHSKVRAAALSKLAATNDAKYGETFKKVLETEQAYPVIAAGMSALYKLSAPAALEAAKKYENESNSELLLSVGEMYAKNPTAERVAFFEKNLEKVNGLEAIGFVGNYAKMMVKTGESDLKGKLTRLYKIGIDQAQSPWRRFACARTMKDLSGALKQKNGADPLVPVLDGWLKEIVEKESNPQLKAVYESVFNDK
jgi:aminopeptidase N